MDNLNNKDDYKIYYVEEIWTNEDETHIQILHYDYGSSYKKSHERTKLKQDMTILKGVIYYNSDYIPITTKIKYNNKFKNGG